MNGSLTREQVEQLLQPIKPHRVLELRGQSHVPAYDVAAHLTRIFGFGGWDKEILSLELVSADETVTSTNKPAWSVTYSCMLRLTIRNPQGEVVAFYDDGACGTSLQPVKGEAHDMAMKSAISYALKRCAAFGLGDQFGLALYNKGSQKTLVGVTLVLPGDGVKKDADLESHIEAPQSLGNDEMQEDVEVTETVEAPTPEKPRAKDQPESRTPPPLSELQSEIKAHPRYVAMESTAKGEFLSDAVGHQVTSIRSLTDEECEQILAKLQRLS